MSQEKAHNENNDNKIKRKFTCLKHVRLFALRLLTMTRILALLNEICDNSITYRKEPANDYHNKYRMLALKANRYCQQKSK